MQTRRNSAAQSFLHLDIPLLAGLFLLSGLGLVVLYSAGGGETGMAWKQGVRLGVGFAALLVLAQIPAHVWQRWVPWTYAVGLGLLIAVLAVGSVGGGAQRWLDLGLFRFQPSELMKLVVPMMVAWYLAEKPLPPSFKDLFVAASILVLPVALIVKQPDLGTSLLIAASGLITLFLAGMGWRLIVSLAGGVIGFAALLIFTPMREYLLHEYQWKRITTFFNPEEDPLGAGYHIIQSKIAIGSGGLFGKGWLNGTQSHLEFLPERSTDFIFAVYSEEFGFIGVTILVLAYLLLIVRGLFLSTQAQGTFARLLAGSIILTFFVYVFVNIGMVSGLLPVVGVPLPLISYGGTSAVSLLAGFGILMGAYSHRRLLSGDQTT